MYKELVIGFLLACLPVVAIVLQERLSMHYGLLKYFHLNWSCYKGDRIFIPMNFLIPMAVVFNLKVFGISLFIALVSNYIFHMIWSRKNVSRTWHSYMFFKNSKRIDGAGIVHFLFSSVQTSLLIIFYVSARDNFYSYLIMLLMLVFGGLVLYGSKKIHGKVEKEDLFVSLLVIFLVLVRLFAF